MACSLPNDHKLSGGSPRKSGSGVRCGAMLHAAATKELFSRESNITRGPAEKYGRNVATGVRQRKFSTSIRSSTEESNRVYRIVRPSGEAVRPMNTLPRLRATVVDLRVAKSKY